MSWVYVWCPSLESQLVGEHHWHFTSVNWFMGDIKQLGDTTLQNQCAWNKNVGFIQQRRTYGDLTEKKTKNGDFEATNMGLQILHIQKRPRFGIIWGSPYQNGGWRRFDRSGICGLPSSGLMWMQIKSYEIIGGEICEQISRKGDIVRFVSFTLPRCICIYII